MIKLYINRDTFCVSLNTKLNSKSVGLFNIQNPLIFVRLNPHFLIFYTTQS